MRNVQTSCINSYLKQVVPTTLGIEEEVVDPGGRDHCRLHVTGLLPKGAEGLDVRTARSEGIDEVLTGNSTAFFGPRIGPAVFSVKNLPQAAF